MSRERLGVQHIIYFHVNDILSSHKDAKVNDKFLEELNDLYYKWKPCTSMREKEYEFLGMTFNYNANGTLDVQIDGHIDDFIENCPQINENTGVVTTPATKNLFSIDNQSKNFNPKQKIEFHSCVAKGLYIGRHTRPGIQIPIAVLSSRVSDPNNSDLQKFVRIAKYLRGTKKLCLTLEIENIGVLKWMVDASHAVHKEFVAIRAITYHAVEDLRLT